MAPVPHRRCRRPAREQGRGRRSVDRQCRRERSVLRVRTRCGQESHRRGVVRQHPRAAAVLHGQQREGRLPDDDLLAAPAAVRIGRGRLRGTGLQCRHVRGSPRWQDRAGRPRHVFGCRKALKAIAAGATAVVIYNNAPGVVQRDAGCSAWVAGTGCRDLAGRRWVHPRAVGTGHDDLDRPVRLVPGANRRPDLVLQLLRALARPEPEARHRRPGWFDLLDLSAGARRLRRPQRHVDGLAPHRGCRGADARGPSAHAFERHAHHPPEQCRPEGLVGQPHPRLPRQRPPAGRGHAGHRRRHSGHDQDRAGQAGARGEPVRPRHPDAHDREHRPRSRDLQSIARHRLSPRDRTRSPLPSTLRRRP